MENRARRPRTIVITGASSGIGLAAAEQLAAAGDNIVLTGRDTHRLAAAVERVRAAGNGAEPMWFQADFERLADVRNLADHLLSMYPKIDVLANNAGMVASSYRCTSDGHEACLQVNHLGPFLLSRLLRDTLRGGRIVNTAARPGRALTVDPADPLGTTRPYGAMSALRRSKAATILFANEAARRWPDILSVSFHPGLTRTNLGVTAPARRYLRHAPLLRPRQAATRLVALATAPPQLLTNGGFYDAGAPDRPNRRVFNADVAGTLWQASERAVAAHVGCVT